MKVALCLILGLVAVLNLSDAKDCTVCKEITLTSPTGGPVTRIAVDGAARVKKVSLRKETSAKGTCVKDSTYGYVGADVFVDMGCSGTFKVCYIKGRTETVTCSSDGTPITCEYTQGGDCDVESAVAMEAVSNHPCTRDYSFHATSNGIIVSKGCQGTFVVGCEDCD